MKYPKFKVSQIIVASLLLAFLTVPAQSQAAGDPSGSLFFNNTYGSFPNKTVSISSTGLGPGTGAFTYELWFKNNMDSSTNTSKISTNIIGTRTTGGGSVNNGFDLQYDFTSSWIGAPPQPEPRIYVYNPTIGTYTTSTGRPSQKAWHHIVFERDGSSNAKIFLDGQLVSSGTDTRDFNTNIITLGEKWPTNNEGGFQGYISNFRYVKGVMVYTGNFTVPTSPLTSTQTAGTNIAAITSGQTQVLLNTPNSVNFLLDSSASAFTVSNNNSITASSGSPFTLPTVTSLSVTSGVIAGGTSSIISGTNLLSTTGVTVGGNAATGVTVNSSNSVTFISPSGSTGAKDVIVSTAYGTFALTSAFTYANAQTITFASLSNITLGGTPSVLSATAPGGAVSFSSSTTAVCSVSGTTITALTIGTCTITADQAGGGGYAATNVSQSFTITSPIVTNTYVQTPAPAPTKTQPPMVLTADKTTLGWNEMTKLKLTGGVDSGTVTYLNSGNTLCIVDVKSSTIITTAPGTCILTAVNSGDFEYIWERSNEITINVINDLPPSSVVSKSISITCLKGKSIKKVSGNNPKCPVGYLKKK